MIVVAYRRGDGVDAIDEYSRRLVHAIRSNGGEARYAPDGLSSLLSARNGPAPVLLQYNPFSYGRQGLAPGLVRQAGRLRRGVRSPLALMVHEAWIDMTDGRSRLIGGWQRAQLRALLRLADRVMTSTQALARELGDGAIHVPVATNITPLQTTPGAARERLGLAGRLVVALFGRANPSRALDHGEAAIAALAEAHGARRLAVLNLGADAPALCAPPGVDIRTPGPLAAPELSRCLWASDLVLLPFRDGVSTRRTTLMAALAHGRAVLALRGHNTDAVLADARGALVLTPVGDQVAFARAAVALSDDAVRGAIGDRGRALYESQFDWPVLARRVMAVLAS